MIYLYYDQNGILRETVQIPVRVGDDDYDKIYIFLAGKPYDADIEAYPANKAQGAAITATYRNDADETESEESILTAKIASIPFDEKRDLKFFRYYTNYQFLVSTAPTSVLATDGTVSMTPRQIFSPTSSRAYGTFTFPVEGGVVIADHAVTISQYDYLMSRVADILENTLHAATSVVTGLDGDPEDFYHAVCEYYSNEGEEPQDGDRFESTYANTYYGGEMIGKKAMLITERNFAAGVLKLYIATKSGSTETVKEIARKEYVDSFFNASGAALKAVADANGDDISSTYAKKAANNTFSGSNTHNGTERFNATASFAGGINLLENPGGEGFSSLTKDRARFKFGAINLGYAVYSFPYDAPNVQGTTNQYTLATTVHISDALSDFLNDNNTFNGVNVHNGNEFFNAPATFSDGIVFGSQSVTNGAAISALNKSVLTFKLGAVNLGYSVYSLPYNAPNVQGTTDQYTLATTSQIATAKAEAISTAASTAQSKVDALATAMDFSNGAFGTIIAETLNVTRMNVSEIETKMASLEDQYFEMLAGNTQPYGNQFVGTVYTKYDGTYDFFVGINNDTLMLGDVSTTRDGDGKILSISPLGLKPLAVRDATITFTDGNLVKAVLENGSVTFKDAGFSATEVMSVLGQERDRQTAEQGRVAAENIRQINLEDDIKNYPYAISQAEFNLLNNGGVFGVHFASGEKVITVYASQAAAEAADEAYIFPMNPDIDYPASDVAGDIPPAPSVDGTYVLKCAVTNGVAVYYWEEE